MGDMISTVFTSFTETITGLAGGIGTAFMNLIYVGGDATGGISPLFTFLLTMAGVGLSAGVLWKLFGLIKGKTSRPM